MRGHPPHLLSYFIGACEQNFDFERGSRECDYTWLFYKISGYVFLARTSTLNIKDAGAAPASFEPLYRSV